MTEKKIIHGNKLIANWIGKKQTIRGVNISNLAISNLKYHSSWDWIHPVYRKIAEIGLWMMTNGHDKLWMEKGKEIEYAMLHEETPEKAMMLISQLIKWYNSQTPTL